MFLLECLERLGRHDEVVAVCDEALTSVPDDPRALRSRACSLHALGQSEKARLAYDDYLRIFQRIGRCSKTATL